MNNIRCLGCKGFDFIPIFVYDGIELHCSKCGWQAHIFYPKKEWLSIIGQVKSYQNLMEARR